MTLIYHDLSFMITTTQSASWFPLFWTTVCLSISKEHERGSQLKEKSFSPIRFCHVKVAFSISVSRLMEHSFKLLYSNSLSRFNQVKLQPSEWCLQMNTVQRIQALTKVLYNSQYLNKVVGFVRFPFWMRSASINLSLFQPLTFRNLGYITCSFR